MKILSVIVLALCGSWAIKPCAASLLVMPSAHRVGPQQMLGHGFGWAIRYGAHGSVVVRTHNGGRLWEDRTPPGFSHVAPDLNDADTYSSSFGMSVLSPRRCWIAFGSRVGGRIVERTADSGRHWTAQAIIGEADSVVLQFLDTRHGFLLVLGGPSAGQMDKRVYRTTDGSRSWQLTSGGAASDGSFYPNGMVFRDAHDGWITASYHGKPDVPLYRTADGGKTWHLQRLPEPAVYQDGGYGNTNPPRFFGPQKRNGRLVVDYKNNVINRFERITYVTRNGGRIWHIGRRKRIKE